MCLQDGCLEQRGPEVAEHGSGHCSSAPPMEGSQARLGETREMEVEQTGTEVLGRGEGGEGGGE